MEREKHIDPNDVDIPELVPIQQYSTNEARILAYVSWLVTKAYGNSVPSEFQDPLYEGNNGESQLKPSLVDVLTSSELYCKACAQLFKDLSIQWKGHMDVIQTLSRKGIYVTDPHESAVTVTLLQQKKPFKLSCHLSLIEALMTAWTNEIVSVERVVQAVRKFSSFNASSELPFDTEDALLFWMNKVCGTVRHRIGKGELIVPDPHHVMVPVMDDLLKDLSDGCCLCVLISFYCPYTLRLQDIALKDPISIADSLYNIQLIRLFCERYLPEKCHHLTVNDIFHGVSDLKVSFVVLVAELFNWLEVKKISVCADVRNTVQTRNMTDTEDRPCTAKKLTSPSVAVPPVSISNVTKRSFQQTAASEQLAADMSGSSPDMHKTSLVMPRQPLLPKRLQQGQTGKLEDNMNFHQPELAWPGSNGDSKPVPQYGSVQSQLTSVTALSGTSTNTSSHLLGNVSMDSDLSMDFTESSVDISEFEDTPRRTPIGPIQKIGGATLAGPGHPDYLELQSVTPVLSTRLSEHQNSGTELEAPQNNQNSHCIDLIMKSPNNITSRNPHDGNPSGGNPHGGNPNINNPHPGNPHGGNPHGGNPNSDNSHSSNPHSGNGNPHPGSNLHQSNPHTGNPNPQGGNPGNGQGNESQLEKLMPAHLKPAKEKLNNSHTKEIESGEVKVVRSPTSPSKQPPRSLNLGSQVNSIVMGGDDSDGSTPDEDYQTPSTESVPLPGEKQSVTVEDSKPQSSLSEPAHAEPKRRQYEAFYVDPDSTLSSNIPLGEGLRSTRTPVTESFVLHDQHHTAETARAAGLPVVAASAGHRLGDLSSGESSDPELQKLRADHRTRETEGSPRPVQGQRPESLKMKFEPNKGQKSKDDESPKTSFAQIKQEKENGDLSSASFGSKNQTAFSLKSQFQKGKTGVKIQKKTTFAALPNQTTWQENAVSATKQHDSNRSFHEGDVSPTSSELIDIKMRLEERRRQIENEKRRMEMQWTKQRQRLGKQAFIQVINRGKSENDLRQAKDEDLSATGRKSGKVLEADDRLSSLIKSRAGKVEEGSPAVLKGSSAPASREQSLDREQSLSSAVASKLQKPARSQLPKEEKAFMSASSHDKLIRSADSAKEMFSEGEPALTQTQISPVKTRPKSYHAPDRTQPTPATTSMSGKPEPKSGQSSLTSSTEKPNLGSSSTSLDRLNTSLSELQGEIMRLSLQQDQIKSLVVHEREPAKTSQSPTPVQAPPSRDDKYYLYPRNAAGEPDIVSAKTEPAQPVAAVAQVTQPPAAGACVAQPVYTPSQQPTQVTGVQYPNQPQPPYGTMPSYPAQYTPFVGNQPQPAGMYTLPQQYTGMPQPHYQATNIYQTPQMYQQQIPGYSGMPHNQWHPSMPPITHHAPSGQSPYSNNTFQPVIQPHSMASVQSPIQRTAGTPDYSPDHHYKAPSGYGMVTSTGPGHSVVAQTAGQSPVPLGLHSPVQPPALSSPVPSTPPISAVMPSPDHSGAEPQHPVGEPQSEGFFVGLDEKTKVEPAGIKDKDDAQNVQPEDDRKMSDSGRPVPQYVDISPVGFVVGDEETDVSVEMSEMEKKRQRLFELQMKRREEQERKRLKKEQEMAKKREEQQAKQEQLQRKKAEEKMRREAIFQEYLKRKEQDSGGEEEPKIAAAVQKRAHSKSRSKITRPKSQPPAAAVEEVPVAPPVAVASVAAPPSRSGDQIDESRKSPTNDIAGKQTGHLMTFPVAPGNGEQTDTNYQQLAFGGLTHRRPPTPERPTRLFLDNSSDTSSNPSSDYTGPKLFKKPSQKSNRHIIVNAISHCCLAGTVNTAVKDKVLDIMSKSDAKHFVILFRDGGQQFKALYTYDPEREEVLKIHGVGPRQLTDDMMERFYKYNSGAKSFTEVTSTKHLSATIDAVVIHNHLWQKKTSTTKRVPNQY